MFNKNTNWTIVRSKKDASAQPVEVTAEPISDIFKSKRNARMRLCVLHNLYFYNTMMSEIRQAIEEGNYKEYKKRKIDGMMNQ